MAATKIHIETVRRWCQSLGVLTAVSLPRQEAEAKLAVYVPMLMREFADDAAFTEDSLNHVARACTSGFPPYPVLCAHLGDWWRGNRPLPPLLPVREAPPPPPLREPPTAEEVAYVHARVQEVVAAFGPTRYADQDYRPPGPRHLPPELLDEINPLRNGRKRAQTAARQPAAVHDTAPENAHQEAE